MDIVENKLQELSPHFEYWEKTKDLIDQLLDIVFNYRQSGHPGGSRSKVHALLVTMLSGVMRWDIRHPEKRFGDRFILSAGHTIPLIYCTLAVLNEAMRLKYKQTGDKRFELNGDLGRVLLWEDLLNFRHNKGLSGHAEMEGKTLFLKFNTGPSAHGSPAALGEALALKRAGASGVRVFAIEGEGGLTAGANLEVMNSAWGLALDNLTMIVDWNDYGIDDHPFSTIVYGTPVDWFAPHGWRVFGAEKGEDWAEITKAFLSPYYTENLTHAPNMIWTKTRKGRGYLKYDNASHGAPHPMNSDLFWQTKKPFADKYRVKFINFGKPAPVEKAALKAEFTANLKAVIDVLQRDQALVDYLSERLVELGVSVPEKVATFRLSKRKTKYSSIPFQDQRLYDYQNYPDDLFVKPGESAANRNALAKWGAWVNAFGEKEYGRPLFISNSADLAESTNISGFAKPYGDFKGYGWYERQGSDEGVLLPQGITEFTNVGLLAGMVTVNFAENPEKDFDGFWGATSTYGSFAYLHYGMLRLFSQLAQDCQWKVGKVLWVAGHSGPETADDSRTHFGIFSPGVTQLFPRGHVINLHPWEHNEVPVMLGAALKLDVPIIALHLTRPPIQVPDRGKLGIPSHFEAARGAYVLCDFNPDLPKGGTIFVQGTSAVANVIKALPEIKKRELNIKFVVVTSSELFALQEEDYRNKVVTQADRADSTVITTQARWLMHDWFFNAMAEKYALAADWDDRWRTGGSLDEVIDEAHLSTRWILEGIERFVNDRKERKEKQYAEIKLAFK